MELLYRDGSLLQDVTHYEKKWIFALFSVIVVAKPTAAKFYFHSTCLEVQNIHVCVSRISATACGENRAASFLSTWEVEKKMEQPRERL